MAPLKVLAMRRMFMELRKICQHPYLSAPELENLEVPEEEQHKQLVGGSGKLAFLKVLLPKLKERGHRVLLFSQFKIALDRIEDFLYGEGYKYLRLDGDVQQAKRQKSMDAFNAPGSDVFIFLLTTRAGGVGINLATADTVIVHDPDFNPHQDQQAIARAHRYGQKKPVMVFKLMTKNSIEERIIEKTKKKLVLDHLIVQNMDRDNEEGQIDDMILHGAKALYDADAEGRSASDIVYTGMMIDDLIDKVAREAQEEMEAQQARDKAKEEEGQAEEGATPIEKPKEFMSFGFAKIWEAGKNELAEVEDEPEPTAEEEAEDQEEAWKRLLESAREAEKRRILEEDAARAARSRRHKLQYQNDGLMSDDSPAKKKKGKKAGKNGVGKNDSDGDFAPIIDATGASDSDGTISDEAEVLQDANGKLITLPGKYHYSEAELAQWNAAKAAGKAAARGKVVAPLSHPTNGAVPPPNGNAVAGPSTERGKKAKETPEEKAARKAAHKEEKRKLREAQKAEARAATAAARPRPPIDDARIVNAQNVIHWLYQTFHEVGHEAAKAQWATLGVLEYTLDQRKMVYRNLATLADDIFVRLDQPPYFTMFDTTAKVYYLLESGAPIIPDKIGKLPEMPFKPPPEKPPQPVPPTTLTVNGSASTSASKSPVLPAAPNPTPIATASSAPTATKTSSANEASDPAGLCPCCKDAKTSHAFMQCKNRLSLPVLLGYRKQLAMSKEKPQVVAKKQKEAVDRVNDLIRLYHQHGNPADSAAAAAILSQATTSQSAPVEPPKVQKDPSGSSLKRPASGTKSEAIIVEDEEEVPPPQKKTRIDLSSSVSTFASSQPTIPASQDEKQAAAAAAAAAAPPASARPPSSPLAPKQLNGNSTPSKSPNRGRPKTFQGCTICGNSKFHIAAECPVVTAGPESIARAISQFRKGDAQYSVLQHLFKKAKRCAFCGKGCNRSVRDCATANCDSEKRGRKALKDLIRQVDVERDKIFEPEARGRLDDRMGQLYDAYQSWPK